MSATNRPTRLTEKLAVAWAPATWNDVTVLVAVSSGADSVALARALHQTRIKGEGRLILAHFNHRLRGAESDGDQAFVEDLGRELGIRVVVGAREEDGEKRRGGDQGTASEESLRELRYAFLAQSADTCGARYVATAHTRDDQVETVLLNVLRGTGLGGLAGMPRTRQLTAAATLIRPLLDVSRDEVIAYLGSLGQSFREDATNGLTTYSRNRIRHELLPLLEREYNPNVRNALLRLSQLAGEADEETDRSAAALASQVIRPLPDGLEVPSEPLRKLSDFLARSLLRSAWRWQGWPEQQMGLDQWNELLSIARLIGGPSEIWIRHRTFPGGIRAETKCGVLRLTRS
jgi:tRNA(Ile)-lysidine synthase